MSFVLFWHIDIILVHWCFLFCLFDADYIFSNEHINCLISYSFDFRNDELLSYYISFLRFANILDLFVSFIVFAFLITSLFISQHYFKCLREFNHYCPLQGNKWEVEQANDLIACEDSKCMSLTSLTTEQNCSCSQFICQCSDL